jgi:hypothetical protein
MFAGVPDPVSCATEIIRTSKGASHGPMMGFSYYVDPHRGESSIADLRLQIGRQLGKLAKSPA